MQVEKVLSKHQERLEAYGIRVEDESEIKVVRYKKGEVILREGMPIKALFIVVEGKAKVYGSAANGRDLLLNHYVADGIVGEVELMLGQALASTTMVALTDFTCIILSFALWAERLRTNIVFMNCMGQALATKLIQCSNQGVATALHDGEKRLCTYILQTVEGDYLEESLTNVASAVGISYRHMLRILKALCDQGLLIKEAKGYHLLDKKALVSISSCR